METIVFNLTGRPRRVRHLGLDYLVAPVTLINPGVLNGSQGPILYELPDIEASVEAWNGVPLLIGHPAEQSDRAKVLRETCVGWVRNAQVQGKLIAEAWFEPNKLRSRNRDLLARIEAGKPIEVSTGLRIAVEHRNGVDHRGRAYTAIARNYQPDHLAILLDQSGACSIHDGCGVNNEREKDMCTCNTQNRVAADQSELLGVPSWEFDSPVANHDQAYQAPVGVVARNDGVAANKGIDQQDLLGVPSWDFPSPV